MKTNTEHAVALKPDPRQGILGDLARQEQSALLRFAPKRNRWRDLNDFEQRLVEIEQRRARLLEDVQRLRTEREAEPGRHSAVLADWITGGEKGTKPLSRLEELDRQIADAQAEYEALGIAYERLLRERSDHVADNRDRMGADVTKAIEEAKADHARLVDQLEAKRQELLDLRATEVWVALFPDRTLANEPATTNLVGGRKAAQDVHLPGVPMALPADGVFNLLRADGRFAATVSTVDQAAAIEGVSGRRLTGRHSIWAGSDEDLERQRREKEERIEAYKREWGMAPREWV